MGAHVHIGKGGKIDKGPKELMEKSEHGAHAHQHDVAGTAHHAAANMKGSKHADTQHHVNAAHAHFEASKSFKEADQHASSGNMREARRWDESGQKHAGEAAKHTDKIGTPTSQVDIDAKPDTHKALHADAADDVKGSEQHEAEHARLLKEYDKSKGMSWQRNAVNNAIAKNATAGMKAKAQSAHHKALATSEYAKNVDSIEAHKQARSAIDKARELHERAGGEGSQGKMKELDTMRKPHHSAIQKDEKESKKAAAKGKPPAGASGPEHHEAEMERHNTAAKAAQQNGNGEAARAHANAYRAHLAAASSHGSSGYDQDRAVAGIASKKADEASKKSSAPGHLTHKHSQASSGHSGIEKIAARAVKKAAEEAADQDPKHKK